jgi:hypothetical protein
MSPQSGVLSWFRNCEFDRECVNSGAATTPSLISIPTNSLRLAPLTSSRFTLGLRLAVMVIILMAGFTTPESGLDAEPLEIVSPALSTSYVDHRYPSY